MRDRMTIRRIQHGEDGLRDEHGNLLPTLSRSSATIRYRDLLDTPLPTFEGSTPGDPFWSRIGLTMIRTTYRAMFSTWETTGLDLIPNDRGSMCTAWHTNGVMDLSGIISIHPSHFVVGARHDLVTRPILGFWARKFAAQPVVRKAELLRGGCTQEEADLLNGRSLLHLASGIAAGFTCALFPEGTSHSKSHLSDLRTGPMRTTLAAAGIAKQRDAPTPVIQPVGLHYRDRARFRTDLWIEFGDPFEVDSHMLPESFHEAIASGSWEEPPREAVLELRNRVEHVLAPMTPNAPDWPTHRAWQAIDATLARCKGQVDRTWREEVIGVRGVRTVLESMEPEDAESIMDAGRAVSERLRQAGLDARSIGLKGELHRRPYKAAVVDGLTLALGLLMLPFILISYGPQIMIGRLLGDRTDEGVDARTTFQFFAGMFGSLFYWPIAWMVYGGALLALLRTLGGWLPSTAVQWASIALLGLVIIVPFNLVLARIGGRAWDASVRLRTGRRRQRMRADQGLSAALLRLEACVRPWGTH